MIRAGKHVTAGIRVGIRRIDCLEKDGVCVRVVFAIRRFAREILQSGEYALRHRLLQAEWRANFRRRLIDQGIHLIAASWLSRRKIRSYFEMLVDDNAFVSRRYQMA